MPVTSSGWWAQWQLDLPVLALAGGLTLLYLQGARRRRRLGVRRPSATGTRAGPARRRRQQMVRFLAGIAALVLASTSPVAVFSDDLFWVHMVQHLLIVVVAAPLLAWGAPAATMRSALPPDVRLALSRVTRRLLQRTRRSRSPHPLLLATAAYMAALWVWHAPVAYDAAASSPALHGLEHASFLGTALWLWTSVVSTARREAGRHALATVCLAALIVQGGVLGALISFTDRQLYTVYDGALGMTALEDQQLAGALMWVPPGLLYATVAIRRFMAWLRVSEQELLRREARERLAAPAPSSGSKG